MFVSDFKPGETPSLTEAAATATAQIGSQLSDLVKQVNTTAQTQSSADAQRAALLAKVSMDGGKHAKADAYVLAAIGNADDMKLARMDLIFSKIINGDFARPQHHLPHKPHTPGQVEV